MTFSDFLKVLDLVEKASEEILKIYRNPESFNTVIKDDNSPITQADLNANRVLCEGLQKLFPDVPIVSEEGTINSPPNQTHWIIDPLDGTKEFLKRNGEFTVNCALIVNDYPLHGIVSVPHQELTYYAFDNKAYLKKKDQEAQVIHSHKTIPKTVTALVSRSHPGKETQILGGCFESIDFIGVGSALKICQIAEGKADIHLRTFHINEWDCAAAQCILEAAGGKMVDLEGLNIPYGQAPQKLPRYLTVSEALVPEIPRLIQKIKSFCF